LLFLVALTALCAVLYFTDTSAGKTTAAVEAQKPQTYLGMTIRQWHRRAVWRTVQRNRARSNVAKMRVMLDQEIRVVGSHPHEEAMLCIHSGEGSWTDPNAPYWGGMQMDMSFQRAYGPEFLRAYGTADNWPVSVQIAVSIRAMLSGRGYYPWPNTARDCNLIG
jgi:hypothetical protein